MHNGYQHLGFARLNPLVDELFVCLGLFGVAELHGSWHHDRLVGPVPAVDQRLPAAQSQSGQRATAEPLLDIGARVQRGVDHGFIHAPDLVASQSSTIGNQLGGSSICHLLPARIAPCFIFSITVFSSSA